MGLSYVYKRQAMGLSYVAGRVREALDQGQFSGAAASAAFTGFHSMYRMIWLRSCPSRTQ